MAKKIKKANVSVPVAPLSPTQRIEAFLNKEKLQVFVNLSHKQVWRCKLVHNIARLLGVVVIPAVRDVSMIPTSAPTNTTEA